MTDIDVPGDTIPIAEEPRPLFTLSLIQLIKTAQAQNGLKHGDYMRYRRHCASRLQSLYKVLKMQHGRTKYQKRKIETQNVTDVRHLHVLVFSAERCWSYAMELKKEMEAKGGDLRKRRHAVRRLAKAYIWAKQLAHISQDRCDTRSILETEAYSAWLHGSVLLERESDWSLALANFMRAKKLFNELAKLSSLEAQTLYLGMVEELEPSERYCNYQISRQGGAVPDVRDLLALGDQEGRPGMELLQSKLAALAEEAQMAQAASTSYLEWQGRKHPVRNERVKLCLHQATEYASQLASTMDVDDSVDAKLALYDKMINAYHEAKSHVRNAQKTSTGDGDAQQSELQGLEAALQGLVLQHTIERSQLLARDAEARFAGGMERLAQGKKLKDKDKFARPEEVVRLVETLGRHYQDLADLGAQLGGRSGEDLHDQYSAKASQCDASRCYYVAHVYLSNDKYAEAHALFQHGLDKCDTAMERAEELPQRDAVAIAEMKALKAKAHAYKIVAAAEYAAIQLKQTEDVQSGVGRIGITETSAASAVGPRYLADHLDCWESFVGVPGGKNARIYKAPYPMEHIPVRPIMLDTASNYITYPSLEHRLKKQEKKSMLSSLFGGWTRK